MGILFDKHEIAVPFARDDTTAVMSAAPTSLSELVQEIARTRRTIRSSVNPRYRFDERWSEFARSLQLDGYGIARDEYGCELFEFVPIEPVIDGAHTRMV